MGRVRQLGFDAGRNAAPRVEFHEEVRQAGEVPDREARLDLVAELAAFGEGDLTFDQVIEHMWLMVGDATVEIARYDFLQEPKTGHAARAKFRLVVSLCDLPFGQRRERAAGTTAWLTERLPGLSVEIVQEAFSGDLFLT